MKHSRFYHGALLLLSVLPLLMLLFFWRRLPAQVPMHWDLGGHVTYGGKGGLIGLAALNPILAVLFYLLPKIDPRRENYRRFRRQYEGVILAILLFMVGMVAIVISEALRPGRLSVSLMVILLIGLLFMLLGNSLPKVKNNFFMGFRTPWTLSSPEIWYKTHRLAGWMMVGSGALMLCTLPLKSEYVQFAVVLVVTVLMVAIPFLMSYYWFRKASATGESDKEEDGTCS
ncbi:MAG: DUF1648 domain-containing protein [Clostridiales bacterium]|nr:DUF1648 domain-containing protein [Clostridiales bacterium]